MYRPIILLQLKCFFDSFFDLYYYVFTYVTSGSIFICLLYVLRIEIVGFGFGPKDGLSGAPNKSPV